MRAKQAKLTINKTSASLPLAALLITGCGTEFQASQVKGSWSTTDIRFVSDQCGIQEMFQSSISEQTYVMGNSNEDDEGEAESSVLTESMVADLQNNIWSHCRFESTPQFFCDFPLPVIHLSAWESALQGYVPQEGESGSCPNGIGYSSLPGNTSGLFLDTNSVFLDVVIELNCQLSGPICNSEISIDLQR